MWVAGFSVEAYGIRIGFRASDGSVLEAVRSRLPFGARPSSVERVDVLYSLVCAGNTVGGRRRVNLLYAATERITRSPDLPVVLDALETHLRGLVSGASRRELFLHAGVVGWRGRAILVPGRSCSGKTNLVRAFVEAGATYYSDEFALLTASGRVRPYAKALSLRNPDGSQQNVPVEQLGGVAGTASLPVGAVLVTHYREGARWRPRKLSSGEALLALVDNSVAVRRRPAVTLRRLRLAVAHAVALKGVRGEAEQVVRAVLSG